jgi:hypothetical protein
MIFCFLSTWERKITEGPVQRQKNAGTRKSGDGMEGEHIISRSVVQNSGG